LAICEGKTLDSVSEERLGRFLPLPRARNSDRAPVGIVTMAWLHGQDTDTIPFLLLMTSVCDTF
jgi:hypothetical protein